MIQMQARATTGPIGTLAVITAIALGSTGALAAVGAAPAGATAAPTTLFSSSTPGVVASPPVVPAGICSVTITAHGGRGGDGGQDGFITVGGAGASVTARVPVAPGDALHVLVAGAGMRGDYSVAPPPPEDEYMVAGGAGGIGGGGGGGTGGGGGGASAVWTPSLQPLVVAGGGGGSRPGPGAGGAGGVLGQPGGDGQTQQRDDGTFVLGGRAGRGGLANGTGGAGGGTGSLDPAGGGGGGVNAGGAGGVPAVSFWTGGDGGDGNGTIGGGGGGAGRRNLDSGDDGGSPPGSGAAGSTAVERQGGTGVAPGGDGGDAQDGYSGSGGGGGVGFGGGGGAYLGVGGGGGGAGYGAGGGSSGDGGGGGGGGSSFVTPSALGSSSAPSARSGDGQVTITYDPAADACPVVTAAQPDGRIARTVNGTYVGNDVYNLTGTGQSGEESTGRGHAATYYVSVQNDASVPDRIRLDGTASNSRFSVTYSSPTNITAAVTAGTYTTPTLAPGASRVIKVVVKAKNGAPANASLAATLVARSVADPTVSDTVGFLTSRR